MSRYSGFCFLQTSMEFLSLKVRFFDDVQENDPIRDTFEMHQ